MERHLRRRIQFEQPMGSRQAGNSAANDSNAGMWER
jgi:hypothetical protein